MAISSDFVTPAELTGFVRNVPTPAAIGLSKYLPDRQVNDIEALITSVTRTNRTAQFRAYDTETPVGSRDSWSRKAIGLPPLGQKTVITEEERIRLEALRTGGSVVQQYIDAIYDDAKLNTDAVLWRMELARGDGHVGAGLDADDAALTPTLHRPGRHQGADRAAGIENRRRAGGDEGIGRRSSRGRAGPQRQRQQQQGGRERAGAQQTGKTRSCHYSLLLIWFAMMWRRLGSSIRLRAWRTPSP